MSEYVTIPKDVHDRYMDALEKLADATRSRTAVTITTDPGQYVIHVEGAGGYTWQRTLDAAVDSAADMVALGLADQLGLQSETDPHEGERYAGDADAIEAIKRSYPIAAVLVALCDALGIETPGWVMTAAKDCEPLPQWRPERHEPPDAA